MMLTREQSVSATMPKKRSTSSRRSSLFHWRLLTNLFICFHLLDSIHASIFTNHFMESNMTFLNFAKVKKERMNITHDLLETTALAANQSIPFKEKFDFSNWLCIDDFLNEVYHDKVSNQSAIYSYLDLPNKCKCVLNMLCANNKPTSTNQISVWFRCYDLNDNKAPAAFVESFRRSSKDRIGKLRQIALDNYRCSESSLLNPLLIRADIVRTNYNPEFIFDFVNGFHHYTSDIELVGLTLHSCSIRSISSIRLSVTNRLRFLNLSRNYLTEFDTEKSMQSRWTNLSLLDLSHNQFDRIDLRNVSALRVINLSNNQFMTLSINELSEKTFEWFNSDEQRKRNTTLLEFNFANNPWNCNESISWLIDLVSDFVLANVPLHGNKTEQSIEPECSLPAVAKMFPFSVWKSVLEVSSCKKCDCYLVENKYTMVGLRYLIVNCTNKNLDFMPTDMPKNAKKIDISNNRLRRLDAPHVSKYDSWRTVNELILQNNSLQSLDGLNQIGALVYLDISGNLLTELPYHILDKNTPVEMRIGNNPYACDCNTVHMQKWLQSHYRTIRDPGDIRCGQMREELVLEEPEFAAQKQSEQLYYREVMRINNLELCPASMSIEIFDVVNCILAAAIVILAVKVAYDFFWQRRTGKLPLFFKLNI